MIIITGVNDVSAELRRIGNNIIRLMRTVNAGSVSRINLTETSKGLEDMAIVKFAASIIQFYAQIKKNYDMNTILMFSNKE